MLGTAIIEYGLAHGVDACTEGDIMLEDAANYDRNVTIYTVLHSPWWGP